MKPYCFGVDVGGTTVKIGLFETTGNLIDQWEIKTRTEDFGKNILPDICEKLDKILEEKNILIEDLEGVGVGLPGPVLDDGTVLGCANLGWSKFNVSETFSKMFHQVYIKSGNDANVAALGEAYKGGGKNYDDIVMVTLGTGVGGGIVLGGKIFTGFSGSAGEIGHMLVNEKEKLKCGCGKKGCLEQYTSATGIVRLAKRYMQNTDTETKMRAYGENITAKDIFDLAKEGDFGANEVVSQMADYLGKAMANIAAVINPQAFVIGGGVSKAGQFLVDAVEKVCKENYFSGCKDTVIRLAELGNDAGIYGAAALVIK